jgi:hypothetical protein
VRRASSFCGIFASVSCVAVDLATGEIEQEVTSCVLSTQSSKIILGGFVPISVCNGRRLAQIRLLGYLISHGLMISNPLRISF